MRLGCVPSASPQETAAVRLPTQSREESCLQHPVVSVARCTCSNNLPRVEYLVVSSVLQRGKLRLRRGGKFAWERSASEWTVLNFLPCTPGLSLFFMQVSLCIECLSFPPFCLANSCSSSGFSWTAPSLEGPLGPHPGQIVPASEHP